MDHRPDKLITAVVADGTGDIFELEGYAAVGAAGSTRVPLTMDQTVDLPFGGELMLLPDRRPVLYNTGTNQFETLEDNPFAPGEPVFPVAAFNSPGYVTAYISAYEEEEEADDLPLFSYGAVGWYEGVFRSPVIRVDRERRQDLRLMKQEDVRAGVDEMRQQMPENRLRDHLENCALAYGCPAGKNFFLGRYEAPLPTSRQCNARCLGCISLQDDGGIAPCQDRIAFTPTPDEVAEVALAHIGRTAHAVVSFGQGCEGDPLLAAHVVEPAIRLVRQETCEGTININTNGSRPEILAGLFDAGLDSIRVSTNSVRKICYDAYFRPQGYRFTDVLESIDLALARNRFVSVNYLNCPGFTDTPQEADAFSAFMEAHPVHQVQWRNLNFDPVRYWNIMNAVARHGEPLGMLTMLRRIRERFPHLVFGYFNPPKEKWHTG